MEFFENMNESLKRVLSPNEIERKKGEAEIRNFRD
jgi:hypothetical protein